jgi:HK97 family phage major capsid protein
LQELHEAGNTIFARSEAEKRKPTDEEQGELDSIAADFAQTLRHITQLQNFAEQGKILAEGTGRKTLPDMPTNKGGAGPKDDDDDGDDPPPTRRQASGRSGTRISAVDRFEDRGKWGWRNFGEFGMAVRQASVNGGHLDERLQIRMATPSTYGSEGVGADGGFAVPPDFRSTIMEKVMGEDSLIARTDQLKTSSNSITIPRDETTPWQTTGGLQAYWESEGGLKTQSKPALEQTTIKLNKLTVLVPVTDELLEDAPSLDSYLKKKAPEKIDFKVSLAIIQGNGVGQPQGILGSPSTVSVAKVSGQAADTIKFANIVAMWSRLYGPCRSRAVWLVNQDIEPQLYTMSFEGTSSSVPAYMPANGLSGSPYATLMGRPVIPSQAMETLGDKGDILVGDFSQYLTATKTGGLRQDVSIHLWFDYDITAFRFVLRVAGQPWWNSAIAPRDNANNTLGCFVTLDERA